MKLTQCKGILMVLLMIAVVQQCRATASDLSSYGSEFYLAFPRNVNGARNLTFTVHTLKTTEVHYSIESLDQDFSYSGTTTARNPDIIAVPLSYEVLTLGYSYQRLGLHITSLETEPISVVAWSESIYSFVSYLGLPCHTQPTNEYVYYAVSSFGLNNFDGYFILVGCMNNTNVTIVPTQHANITMKADPQLSISAIRTYRAGESNTFVIHAGQTIYVYQDYADISGTKIVSDAPLTVITGHTAAKVPAASASGAEPIATQVPPTITWGKEFLLSPHHNRFNGQFYKIIAHRNGTNIQRRCGTSPAVNATLSSGQVYQFNTSYTTYCSLISNKAIYVGHIGTNTLFNSGYYGDPTLNTVPPINQYIHSIEYTTFFPLYNGLSIIVPNDQYNNNSLKIDNELYNITWSSDIHYPNGSIAGYVLSSSTSGTHVITHPHPSGGLFLSVYGWATYHGYAFSGGMGLNPINPALPLPRVSFTQELYLVTEGNTHVIVCLNRSTNIEEEVSVRVSAVHLQVDTAKAGDDYLSISEVVTFRDGEVLHNVSIAVNDDHYVEPTEYFTLRLEAIGQDVLVFPITECVIEIHDNDYLKIGFDNTSMTIASTELVLDVSRYYGILQSGESSTIKLQVESLSGIILNVTRFDFYNYSGRFTAALNLSDLPLYLTYSENDAILKGKLVIDTSQVNATLEPSIVTVTYNPQTSKQDTETSVNCVSSALAFVSTIYITPTLSSTGNKPSSCPSVNCVSSALVFVSTVYITPTLSSTGNKPSSCPSVNCVSSALVFVSTVYITPTLSSTVNEPSSCPSISLICLSAKTIISTVYRSTQKTLCATCSSTPTTQQAEQTSLNSNMVIGGIMGYIILIIICIVGVVGGFLCGRRTTTRQRMTMMTNEMPIINSYPLTNYNPNDYEGQKKTLSKKLSKNQFLPLPTLPSQNTEEIYDDVDVYMEMTNPETGKEEKTTDAD